MITSRENCEHISSVNSSIAAIEQMLRYRKCFMEKDCNQIKEEINKIKSSVEPLKKKIAKLENDINHYESINLDREKENADLDFARESLQKSNRTLQTQTQAIQQQNKALKEMINSNVLSDEVPSLSIQMDSLLDLNSREGWKITAGNPDKLREMMTKDIILLAVIGMYDVGKSWFCNEFTGKKIATAGVTQRTDGINFYFPEEEGKRVGIIDTPGSNEAIRVNQEDLIRKVEAAYETEDNVEESKDARSEERYLLQYKLLKNDARILQDLKQRFIGEVADVLIFICNKLSEKEQENIYKVIKHHKKIQKDRKANENSKASNRETYLYIVHNYKMLTEIDEVKAQIQRDIFESFKDVKETPLTNESIFPGCNQFMYQDQFGIPHLILAAKGSPAGKYYNYSTINFLKNKVLYIENRTSANVKELFLKFCDKNLPVILKQEDIRLKLNPDETAIVKEDGPKIRLENLRYDEFGNVYCITSAFEPRYSMIQRNLEGDKKEVTVDMELLDTKFEADYDLDAEGYWYLNVKEKKHFLLKQLKKVRCMQIRTERKANLTSR